MVLAVVTAKTVFLIGAGISYGLAGGLWWVTSEWEPSKPRMWQAHLARAFGYFAYLPPVLTTAYLVWVTLLSGTTIRGSAGDWIALLVGVPIYFAVALVVGFGACFYLAFETVAHGDEWRDKAVARKAEQEAERRLRASLP